VSLSAGATKKRRRASLPGKGRVSPRSQKGPPAPKKQTAEQRKGRTEGPKKNDRRKKGRKVHPARSRCQSPVKVKGPKGPKRLKKKGEFEQRQAVQNYVSNARKTCDNALTGGGVTSLGR